MISTVEHARALLAAGEYDEMRQILRAAAEEGAAGAALELGWLLSLRWDKWAEADERIPPARLPRTGCSP